MFVVVQIFAAPKRESETFQGRIDWSAIDNLEIKQENTDMPYIIWKVNNINWSVSDNLECEQQKFLAPFIFIQNRVILVFYEDFIRHIERDGVSNHWRHCLLDFFQAKIKVIFFSFDDAIMGNIRSDFRFYLSRSFLETSRWSHEYVHNTPFIVPTIRCCYCQVWNDTQNRPFYRTE